MNEIKLLREENMPEMHEEIIRKLLDASKLLSGIVYVASTL